MSLTLLWTRGYIGVMAARTGSKTRTGSHASSDADEINVVKFLMGDETYALGIDKVSSIVDMESKKVTRLPRAPDAVDGIVDLRGETTAIIDPAKLLNVETRDDDSYEILVLDRDDDKQKVGIRVDEVIEVRDYTTDRVDMNGQLRDIQTHGIEEKMVKGIIRELENEDEIRAAEENEEETEELEEEVSLIVLIDVDRMISVMSESESQSQASEMP